MLKMVTKRVLPWAELKFFQKKKMPAVGLFLELRCLTRSTASAASRCRCARNSWTRLRQHRRLHLLWYLLRHAGCQWFDTALPVTPRLCTIGAWLANRHGGPGEVRFDAHTRPAQRDCLGDLRWDVRLRERREVDVFPDRCGSCFRVSFVTSLRPFFLSVDGSDDLRASDAIDPIAHATDVAVDFGLCRGLLKKTHGDHLEWVRFQRLHEDPDQETRES